MADFIDPENFEFFARYFLAGFILASVRSRYVLGERPRAAEFIFESVILSLLNQMVFLFLVFLATILCEILVPDTAGILAWMSATRVPFFLETLALPVMLGLFLDLALRRGWSEAVLRSLAMPIIHPTRRAFDFAFGDITTKRFVIVTYADGTVVYGFFGANSLTSSDPANRDIYLELLYDVVDGVWRPTMPPKSALLLLRDLRSIEFIEPVPEARNGP